MRIILLLFALFVAGCQELPKEYRGEEGKKKLERYRYQFVKGVVEVSGDLRGKIPEKPYFLIISLRDLENPMPVAVLRVRNPEFPFKFKITGRHKLRADRMIEGDLILTARISKNPGADPQPGDLVGVVQVRAGQKGVRVLIDSEVR
ncbi:MAG: hypothetical protein Q9N26_08110 [Aquificota bacterium]|nr:hypothetical protein [Aquificota bacterium]